MYYEYLINVNFHEIQVTCQKIPGKGPKELITIEIITKAIDQMGLSKADGEMLKTAREAGAAEVGDLIKTRPLVKSVCLFDLILYVPSTIFQLHRDGSSWVEPVLS